MSVIAQGTDQTGLYRMNALRIGLQAEMNGMRLTSKAPTCYSMIKAEYGLKGNKAKVLHQFMPLLEAEERRVGGTFRVIKGVK
jgi:hypothetical protein